MIDSKTLKKAFHAELSKVGCIRKGSTWYLRNDEIISMVNIQKSNYSSLYFLNLGFWLRDEEGSLYPPEEDWHVRTRAEVLWRTDDANIADLLNLDVPYENDAARLDEIRCFVRETIAPFLVKGATLVGLKSLLSNPSKFLIRRDVWRILGIDDSGSSPMY